MKGWEGERGRGWKRGVYLKGGFPGGYFLWSTKKKKMCCEKGRAKKDIVL